MDGSSAGQKNVMKDGDDLEVDPWTKEKRDKKERIAKNEHSRLKNIGTVFFLGFLFRA